LSAQSSATPLTDPVATAFAGTAGAVVSAGRAPVVETGDDSLP
jgi:hypothetical protein